MHVYSEGDDFVPEHFDILRFYDETLLFAWHVNKLKLFRYDDPTGADALNFRLLLAPGTIKYVQSFDQRIFITCSPCGVYKLSKNYQFALLSSTAIGIGARIYQVLKLENTYISLCDKQAKTSRLLLKYNPIDDVAPRIIGLVGKKIDNQLLTMLLEGTADQDESYIFCSGYNIYKVTPNAVKILHNCPCFVTDVVEVKANGELTCLLFITNKSILVLMYAQDNELIFENIDINHAVKTAYAFVDEILKNTVWIIYSDGLRTYKCRKIQGKHSVQVVELCEQNIACLRDYNSEILGLKSTGELVQVDLQMQQNLVNTEHDDFIELKREMLEGTDDIVEAICGKVKELQSFDTKLLNQQRILKRINIVACKQNILKTPRLQVHKIANKTIVNGNFGYTMPEQCQLSFSIKSGGRKIFATKQVTENEIDVDLPVPNSILSEASNITTDLITLADEGYSWCFIKNCMNDAENNKVQVQMSDDERNNLIDARLAALHNLKIEEGLNIVKLNAIKSSMRKEFNII